MINNMRMDGDRYSDILDVYKMFLGGVENSIANKIVELRYHEGSWGLNGGTLKATQYKLKVLYNDLSNMVSLHGNAFVEPSDMGIYNRLVHRIHMMAHDIALDYPELNLSLIQITNPEGEDMQVLRRDMDKVAIAGILVDTSGDETTICGVLTISTANKDNEIRLAPYYIKMDATDVKVVWLHHYGVKAFLPDEWQLNRMDLINRVDSIRDILSDDVISLATDYSSDMVEHTIMRSLILGRRTKDSRKEILGVVSEVGDTLAIDTISFVKNMGSYADVELLWMDRDME